MSGKRKAAGTKANEEAKSGELEETTTTQSAEVMPDLNLLHMDVAAMDSYPTLDKDDTLNRHRTLDVLSQINPLFLKNEAHLTPEERNISEAFKRRTERRIESIKARCDFYEI